MNLCKFLGLAVALPCTLLAITPGELQQRLAAGEPITVIDVRGAIHYQKGHITGAISVPAALCADKKLPPLGRVVVYDEGLGLSDAAARSAEILSAKPGITAEVLDTGYAGWETLQHPTTQNPGLRQEELPLITFQQVKKLQVNDLVLVDLRKPEKDPTKTATGALEPLTDLSTEFPKAQITRSPFDLPAVKSAKSNPAGPPLLVLIDTSDGSAETMARALRANGMARFAILAGGESILVRKGEPGLQRSGRGLPSRIVGTGN